jgi:multidrug resistance protein EbrB
MTRPILFLLGAVFFEVLWAVMLKIAGGSLWSWATAAMAVAYALSLIFLNLACKSLDLSLAYAVWTGAGATLVALAGVVLFRETLSLERSVGFALVIAGLVVLIGLEPRASFEASPHGGSSTSQSLGSGSRARF